jgi:hypothetical protein
MHFHDQKEVLNEDNLAKIVLESFVGLAEKRAYGERTVFYNPMNALSHGSYFCTIKSSDGPNDKSSHLDRHIVFRFSFKPSSETYQKFFGDKPQRPKKGESIDTHLDLSEVNSWMPHAIYGWMGWTMVISPTWRKLEEIWPYLNEAYFYSKKTFEMKQNKKWLN